MADLAHWFGNDLNIAANGDLLSVNDPQLTEQRIVRRMLTPKGSYFWHPNYGAGLAQYIGQPASARTIQGVIRAQLKLESSVASSPLPQITVSVGSNGVTTATIVYWNNQTGSMRTVSFPVNQALNA